MSVSSEVVIMTRAELEAEKDQAFQRGVGRGRFEERMSPSEAIPADVLAMKEACKRAALDAVQNLRSAGACNFKDARFAGQRGCDHADALYDAYCAIGPAIDKLSPEAKAEGEQHVATVTYTNWRGEASVRRIIPKAVRYGVTAWHPQPQWLMLAWDDDKQADREFALKDFGSKAEGGRGEPDSRTQK